MFIHESRLNLQGVDGTVQIRKLTGECLDPAIVVKCDGFGGKTVMVWGGISDSGKTELLTIDGNLTVVRYCNKDVVSVAVLYINNGVADVLKQDSSRLYTTRHIQCSDSVQCCYSIEIF